MVLVELQCPLSKSAGCLTDGTDKFFFFLSFVRIMLIAVVRRKYNLHGAEGLAELNLSYHVNLVNFAHTLADDGTKAVKCVGSQVLHLDEFFEEGKKVTEVSEFVPVN